MVKRKQKPASPKKTVEENEASEASGNALADTKTSDSGIVDVEPKMDEQDKLEPTVDEANNEKNEERNSEDEDEKVMEVKNDENPIMIEINGDEAADPNASEDDEIDDQEDAMWGNDEENFEEDDEENVVGEDEVSEDYTTEEEYDDNDDDDDGDGDGDEVDEEEATDEEGEEEDDNDDDDDNDKEENTEGKEELTKGDEAEAEKHNTEKVEVNRKNIEKLKERSGKKLPTEKSKKVDSGDKAESSRKRKKKKRVESMGMIFICSSKTKNDCYQYRVFGLPESKKDVVKKIYTGMRLFLYDVDLKLMYGIYKAAGPGGYNIEPKAFKSQFPSQVRFKVLDDCLPLAEEKFKKVIKENYYTKTKFDCILTSEQVKKLCKLFISSSKGPRTRIKKLGSNRKAEKHPPVRRERTRRPRAGDERRLALREDRQYHERPRKRLRKAAITRTRPLRQPLTPPPLPSTVPSYAYERTLDVDAYRRDPYLERHSPYREGRDPLLDRIDPYRNDRDPYLERRYAYRDDPLIERRDVYREVHDPYPSRLDHRDGRDSYLERRDPYRDARDSYLERRGPYRDDPRSITYSTYRRDPISDRRDVYREDRAVEYRDSYRRDELLERREARDLRPLSLETRRYSDIAPRDSYVSYRERPSYAETVYSAEYPSRLGSARQYHL